MLQVKTKTTTNSNQQAFKYMNPGQTIYNHNLLTKNNKHSVAYSRKLMLQAKTKIATWLVKSTNPTRVDIPKPLGEYYFLPCV